jgi:DNA-binding NtrC family response regulator
METAEATMKGSIPSLALVVEDDPLQREFLCDLLRNENLDVIQCESAEAAELIVARSGPDLTLLVTDAALAGRGTGLKLAQFAKRKFPGLNVILVSGQDGLTPPDGVRFFRKPFVNAELVRAAMGSAS